MRVRLFAALREAAGEPECRMAPGTVADLLDRLRARYGEPFSSRLVVASVLLDGDTVPHDADRLAADGAELALLPPVSGGCGRRPRRLARRLAAAWRKP